MPTFRDDKNGLWAKFDPYELSSVQGWERNPERVWGWYLWRHYLCGTVEPNDGHRAVAAWQDHAEVSVVTQNVDNLHERAGSSPVHHLHGSLFEFRCATCGLPYTGELPEMTRARTGSRAAVVRLRRSDPARHRVVRRGAARGAVAARSGGDDQRRRAGRGGNLEHRLPGGESARVGAGARDCRRRGQPRAHTAVRTAPRSRCANRPARPCRRCCSGCPPC